MSEKLKIKISIADRVYPLSINANQEEGLRKAAKKIEHMIEKFEQSYAVRDKQDVLAMSALQFASQTEQNIINNETISIETEQKLNKINEFLDNMLG